MSEKDILNVLENNYEALSIKEISELLLGKSNIKTIQKAIKQLEKYGEVESVRLDVRVARKIYGNNLKKGIKLFYVVKK